MVERQGKKSEEKRDVGAAAPVPRPVSRGGIIFGLVLVTIGIIFFVDNFFPGLGFGRLWPVIIIVWGASILVSAFIPPITGAGLLRGVFIVTVGVILLYNTLGLVPFSFWVNILALWPVFLVALGLAVLAGVLRSRAIARLPGIFLVLTLILAFAYQGVLSDRFTSGAEVFEFSRESIGSVRRGSAVIDFRVGDLEIGATDALYEVEAREPGRRFKPRLRFQRLGSRVDLNLRPSREDRVLFLGGRRSRWTVLLSRDVNWALNLDTGVSDAELDFSDVKLERLEFDGGVGDATIRFGDRVRRATASIEAGVSRLRLLVPEDLGVRLRVSRGLSTTDFRDVDLERVSGGDMAVYETPDFGESARKLFLTVDMGVSSFVVERY